MKDYFYLQFLMANRKMRESRIHPMLGYVLVFLIFGLLSEFIFYKTELAKYLYILSCISFQFKIAEKNRIDFLKITFGNAVQMKIRVLENLAISLPFSAFLVWKNLYFEAIILFLCSVSFSFFTVYSDYNLTIPTPFSQRPFEFSTGFRKTFFIFPISYIMTLIAIHVDNLYLGIFSFLSIFLTSMSYYTKTEHVFYVWVYSKSPKDFLRRKVLQATTNVTILVLPSLLSLLLFFPSEFDLILLSYLIGLLFLWAIVLAKYASFPDDINLPEAILVAFCILFPPLLLVAIPFFYTKAIDKLNPILNDKN